MFVLIIEHIHHAPGVYYQYMYLQGHISNICIYIIYPVREKIVRVLFIVHDLID